MSVSHGINMSEYKKERETFELVWIEWPSILTDKESAFRWFLEGWIKAQEEKDVDKNMK
jgi:hypothetical protein